MILTNAFERYYMILSLLLQENFISTLKTIHHTLHIPLKQLREDFKELMKAPAVRNLILIQKADDFPDYFYEMLTSNERKNLSSDILSGKYDDSYFCLDGYEWGFNTDSLLLPVNAAEYLALRDYFPEFARHSSNFMDIYQKHTISSPSNKHKEWIKRIEEAIEKQNGLKLFRRTRQGMSTFHIMPERIFHDTYEDTMYVIDSMGLSHPLDSIRSMSVIPGFETTKNQIFTDYMWGISYRPDEKVEDVTLIIDNGIKNVINKLRADTSRRKYGHLELQDDGTYIYKDKVIGMDAFRRWLRSYGSAIIVQSPKHLALEMYQSAKRMYNNYENQQFIDD